MTEYTPAILSEGKFNRNGPNNLVIENARFFMRPNFSGTEDRFGDARPKFNVVIPNEHADELRELGWNVKTLMPRDEEEEELSYLKVMIDFIKDKNDPKNAALETGADVWLIMGDEREKLNSVTAGILDRTRVQQMDMEIRAWEYNPREKPGEYSARLVALVATIIPNRLEEKYGRLG